MSNAAARSSPTTFAARKIVASVARKLPDSYGTAWGGASIGLYGLGTHCDPFHIQSPSGEIGACGCTGGY
jgi:hypothetical protein